MKAAHGDIRNIGILTGKKRSTQWRRGDEASDDGSHATGAPVEHPALPGLCTGRRTDELVLLNQHGHALGTSHQIRPMRETCEAAGVEHAGFHILRHTYGSRLAMAGVPMAVIAEALGHADERITRKHYAHLCPSYVRDAVRAGRGDYGIVQKSPGIRLVQ